MSLGTKRESTRGLHFIIFFQIDSGMKNIYKVRERTLHLLNLYCVPKFCTGHIIFISLTFHSNSGTSCHHHIIGLTNPGINEFAHGRSAIKRLS